MSFIRRGRLLLDFFHQEKEEEEKPIKKLLAVKLMKFDTAKKVALIKTIKSIIPGMNLVQVTHIFCICCHFDTRYWQPWGQIH